MLFFEWWGSLSPKIRIGLSLFLLLISTGLWFAKIFWPWGWVAGTIMLMFSFPSQNEKRGYHDL